MTRRTPLLVGVAIVALLGATFTHARNVCGPMGHGLEVADAAPCGGHEAPVEENGPPCCAERPALALGKTPLDRVPDAVVGTASAALVSAFTIADAPGGGRGGMRVPRDDLPETRPRFLLHRALLI